MTNNIEHTDTPIVPDMEQIIETIETSKSQQQDGLILLAQLFTKKLERLQKNSQVEAHKTDHLQRKFEAMLRQFDIITSQFVDERVVQPWIKEFVDVCESLRALFTPDVEDLDPDVLALIEKMERRLADADVAWISPEIGVPFKPACHKAVEAQVTPDESLHGCIAKVFRKGFAHKDHPVKYAQVSVFRYQPQS